MSLTSPRAALLRSATFRNPDCTNSVSVFGERSSETVAKVCIAAVNVSQDSPDGSVELSFQTRAGTNTNREPSVDYNVDVLINGEIAGSVQVGGDPFFARVIDRTVQVDGLFVPGEDNEVRVEGRVDNADRTHGSTFEPAVEVHHVPSSEPAVEVVSCSLDPPEFTIGDDVPVTMALEVRNDTGETVAIDAVIRVDGTEVNQLSAATIDAQSSRTFNISIGSGLSWEFGAGTFEPTFEITNVA